MRNLSVAVAIAMTIPAIVAAHGPAAQANEPYFLFFDWGKPDLTSDAAIMLDQAVSAYRQAHGMRLRIAGYADRSGSASYNLLASRRRAEAVRAELARRGVPSNAMTVVGFGEERPIVPTEDGVREVQNRRVEITIEPPSK